MTIEDVDRLGADEIGPAMLQLASVLARLAARQRELDRDRVPPPPVEPDELLDVDKVATFIQRSKSWVRRHGATRLASALRQPGGKGTCTRWSRDALKQWRDGTP
jgi:hypothetical protein